MISHAQITKKALEVFGDKDAHLHRAYIDGGIFVLNEVDQQVAIAVAEKQKELDKEKHTTDKFAEIRGEDLVKIAHLTTKNRLLEETLAIRDEAAEKMAVALECITIMEPDTGIEGCTYGDTEHDRGSVAYGSNQTLEYIKNRCLPALSAWNAVKEGGKK